MNQDTMTRLLETVLREGTPFQAHWVDEGDAESGPMSGTTYGLRWGKVKLAESPNGSIDLLVESKRTPYGFRVFQPVYSSHAIDRQPHPLGRRVRDAVAMTKRTLSG